jgi:hypothetical protein
MRPQGFGQVGNGLEDLGWNDMGFEPPKPADASRDATHDAFGDDVVDHPRAHPTGLTPIQSPVHSQQAEIEDRFGVAEEADEAQEVEETAEDEIDETAGIFPPEVEETVAAAEVPAAPAVVVPMAVSAAHRGRRPRAAPGSKAKAAFTLRLDPDRHLKLRLACAVGGRSAQQFVTDALDQLLERMPEVNGLAAKAKRRG